MKVQESLGVALIAMVAAEAAVRYQPPRLYYPYGFWDRQATEMERRVAGGPFRRVVTTSPIILALVCLLLPSTVGAASPSVVYRDPYATSKTTRYTNTFACTGASAIVVSKPFVRHQSGRLGGALNVSGGICSLGGFPYSPQAYLSSELRGLAYSPTTTGVHTLLLRWHVVWNALGYAPASCDSFVWIIVGGEYLDNSTHLSVGSNFTTAYSNYISNSTASSSFNSTGTWNGTEAVNASLRAGHHYNLGAFIGIEVLVDCSTANAAYGQVDLASPGLGAWIRSIRVY